MAAPGEYIDTSCVASSLAGTCDKIRTPLWRTPEWRLSVQFKCLEAGGQAPRQSVDGLKWEKFHRYTQHDESLYKSIPVGVSTRVAAQIFSLTFCWSCLRKLAETAIMCGRGSRIVATSGYVLPVDLVYVWADEHLARTRETDCIQLPLSAIGHFRFSTSGFYFRLT